MRVSTKLLFEQFIPVTNKHNSESIGLIGRAPMQEYLTEFSYYVIRKGDNTAVISVNHSDLNTEEIATFRDCVPVKQGYFLGIDNKHIQLLHPSSKQTYDIYNYEYLLVARGITLVKAKGSWKALPIDTRYTDLNRQVVELKELKSPLLATTVRTNADRDIPLILDKTGLYIIGIEKYLKPFQKKSKLTEPQLLQQVDDIPVYSQQFKDVSSSDIDRLLNIKVIEMQAIMSGSGEITMYFLTEDGKLYGTGSNKGAKLALPNKVKELPLLKELNLIDENVGSIDVIYNAGIIYSKPDGSYYLGSTASHAQFIRSSSIKKPYKFTDRKIKCVVGSIFLANSKEVGLQLSDVEGCPVVLAGANDKHKWWTNVLQQLLRVQEAFPVNTSLTRQRFFGLLPSMITQLCK